MFTLFDQHLDLDSGHHVVELRDLRGNQHFVQIAIGHESCVACGTVFPKDNLGVLDPKAMAQGVVHDLNRLREAQLDYAAKHALRVK